MGHVLIASNIGEVLITVAKPASASLTASLGGSTSPPASSRLHTVSMSPQVAHQVMMRLSAVLSEYTRKYGRVPEDPAFSAAETHVVN